MLEQINVQEVNFRDKGRGGIGVKIYLIFKTFYVS
jgi:hypothetical protein